MSDDEFGPPLPPGFQNPVTRDHADSKVDSKLSQADNSDVIGPSLPPSAGKNVSDDSDSHGIGPSLPPSLSLKKDLNKDSDLIGPCLPPGLSKSPEASVIGPSLPPGVSKSYENETNMIGPCLPPGLGQSSSAHKTDMIGPCLPPVLGQSSVTHTGDDSDSDNDNYIGPQPSEMSNAEDDKYYTTSEFEKRARLMRDKLEGKDSKSSEKLQRESWMMELPSAGLAKNIGLTARTFRTKAGPDMGDRSVWTDTPADREKKEKEGYDERGGRTSHESHMTSKRDKDMAKEVDKYNKSKRPISLLEMHEKERKKLKKEKKDEPKVRRPFDREVDLQSNRFDEAQRQSIIKKSRDLNTKFSKGKFTSQFL